MAFIANLLMVNNNILENLNTLKKDELSARVYELIDSDSYDLYGINAIWDGLCFFLSGKSHDVPPDNSSFGKAIYGSEYFGGLKNDCHLAFNRFDLVLDIVKSLENVNLKKLAAEFEPKDFIDAGIEPPDFWEEENTYLIDLLTFEHRGLLSFYREAMKKKMNVIVSIL